MKLSCIILFYANFLYALDLSNFPLHEEVLTDYMTFDGAYMDKPSEYDSYTEKYNLRNERDDHHVPAEKNALTENSLIMTDRVENFAKKYSIQTSRSYLSAENERSRFSEILEEVRGVHDMINSESTSEYLETVEIDQGSIDTVQKNIDTNNTLYPELVNFNTKQIDDLLEHVDLDIKEIEKNPKIDDHPLPVQQIPDPIQHNYDYKKQTKQIIDPIQRNVEQVVQNIKLQDTLESIRETKQEIKQQLQSMLEKHTSEQDHSEAVEEIVTTTNRPTETTEISLRNQTPNGKIKTLKGKRIFYYFKDPVLNNIGRRFFYTLHRHKDLLPQNGQQQQRSIDKSKFIETASQWGEKCSHDPESICVFSRQCGSGYRMFIGDSFCKGSEKMVCCELHGCQWKLLIDESSDSHSEEKNVNKLRVTDKKDKRANKKLENDDMFLKYYLRRALKNISGSLEKIENTRKTRVRLLNYFKRNLGRLNKMKIAKAKKRRHRSMARRQRNHQKMKLDTLGTIKLLKYLIKDALGQPLRDNINRKKLKAIMDDLNEV